MIKAKNFYFCDKHKFSNTFHINVLGPEDQVTSSLVDRLVVHEEFFYADLRFPLHPFIINILDLYQVVLAQLASNSFRILCSRIIFYHFLDIQL